MVSAAVRLAGIGKRYGDNLILSNLDLFVPAGTLTVLLGPSGCGKSSLLRIIAGLDADHDGMVWIGDRNATALAPVQRGIAMVFQSYALFPHLSVAENIVFGLRARGVPRQDRDARLRHAASMVGLEPLLDRRPHQLSGGQQQRVALARAIVAEAPVCLMDEPLSNLDAQLRQEMRREICALQRQLGLTMIYVTHDQTEAMSMADQVVVMRAGRIEQSGTPFELHSRPATAFVAGFLGAPPMNLLPLEHLDGGWRLAGDAVDLPLPRAIADRPVWLGLRPQHLRIDPGGPLRAIVDVAEFLGNETLVTARLGPGRHTLQALLPGHHAIAPGSRLTFTLPAELAVFDRDTGDRVSVTPLPAPQVPA